jgi:2,3-bisphosphoglycerate-dependent phosphoglycerate mutase
MKKRHAKLILMRHGQSIWNKLNLFTGWVDIPLSQEGIDEALKGGEKIKDIPIDVIFVSALVRSQMTAFLAMLHHFSKKVPVLLHKGEGKMDEWGQIFSKESEATTIPTIASWHLNERMYGALQGLNKAETAKQYGAEQVQIWRRSYDVAPPQGESLEMTAKRTIPYFKEKILPYLQEGKTVFVSAHGNSLRSIIMYLDKLTKEEVVKLELPTGDPMIYPKSGSCFW